MHIHAHVMCLHVCACACKYRERGLGALSRGQNRVSGWHHAFLNGWHHASTTPYSYHMSLRNCLSLPNPRLQTLYVRRSSSPGFLITIPAGPSHFQCLRCTPCPASPPARPPPRVCIRPRSTPRPAAPTCTAHVARRGTCRAGRRRCAGLWLAGRRWWRARVY